MEKTSVFTAQAPEAIGPYSQAIVVGDMVFVSGQLPMNPRTGDLMQDNMLIASKMCLRNLKEVLSAAGASLSDVVKTTVFLSDIKDFADFNTIYHQYFDGTPPARSCVMVSTLPKNAKLEIEAIAVKNCGEKTSEAVTEEVPAGIITDEPGQAEPAEVIDDQMKLEDI